MGKIESGRGSVQGLAGSQHHLQASTEDREESARSRGSVRGGAGAGPDCSPPEPHKDPVPREGKLPEEGSGFLGQSQPTCPSSSGLSLGQLTLRGGKGWCSPSPVGPQTSEGLGGTFLAFYKKPAAQGPAPGREEPSSKLRPFSAWVSGLSSS